MKDMEDMQLEDKCRLVAERMEDALEQIKCKKMSDYSFLLSTRAKSNHSFFGPNRILIMYLLHSHI